MSREQDLATALRTVTTLLCDADGTLFPSEEPAYDASATVTNELLAELGVDRSYSPAELQSMTHGQNFRSAAVTLAEQHDRQLSGDDLERWVQEERRVVTEHLREVLGPMPAVLEPVAELAQHYRLAAVTSSAGPRLDACLEVTGLAPCFPPECRFSAETSLPEPTSKPDPAVYAHAGRTLGISAEQGLAVEDSITGATSAVAAGFATVGTVQFVPAAERSERSRALEEAGAVTVVADWAELAALLRATGYPG